MAAGQNGPPSMSKPSVYRIEVHGRIASSWSARLEGMQITGSRAKDGSIQTTLIGRLDDQAALSGVMNTLYELHLAVVSVECLDSEK